MDLEKARKEIERVDSIQALEEVRIKYLGRKGMVAELFSQLPKLKGEERARRGQELNALKQDIMTALQQKEGELQSVALGKLAESEKLDVTLPGARPPLGHLHITTTAIEEITRIFAQLGFYRRRYPEVDWDYYAFEALNMPKDHPARDEWETFFVAESVEHRAKSSKPLALSRKHFGRMVLTPHTSNGQVREMERRRPPIRMINIAKCYRRQSDVTHAPMFHQFEGLMIGKNVSVAHLKGTLDFFARAYYGEGRRTRLRPFHFRFTEPSFEIDISCGICGGTGKLDGARCKVCKSGWHELGGAGMVHPKVLKAGGVDPKKYSGFACGWGIERMLMMKEKLSDIRAFYTADLNFLEQF